MKRIATHRYIKIIINSVGRYLKITLRSEFFAEIFQLDHDFIELLYKKSACYNKIEVGYDYVWTFFKNDM